jgi:hypothetical protein
VEALELMPDGAPRIQGQSPLAVIVLGASNVSRGLARLTATVRRRAERPFDLFVAAGHGRSYGANSRVWMRRLPSILGCGLWRALDRDGIGPARGPCMALVTDIGNDLLYGFPPEQVAAWVGEAVDRLTDRGAKVAIARLPLEAVSRVGPVRYRALKTFFVPGCPLSIEGIRSAAADLDGRLAELAARSGLATIDQPGEWYGFDTLHPRRRRLDTLWNRACDAWGLPPASHPARAGFREWSRLGSRAAEVRMLGHRMLHTRQPIHRYPDGGSVSLY